MQADNLKLALWYLNLPANFVINRMPNKGVHNLTTAAFTSQELDMIAHGTKFIITPKNQTNEQIITLFHGLMGKIQATYSWFIKHGHEPQQPYHPAYHVTREHEFAVNRFSGNTQLKQYYELTLEELNQQLATTLAQPQTNTPYNTMGMCNTLKQHPDVMFKAADKNLGTTIIPREWYSKELLRQLSCTSTYKETTKSDFMESNTEVRHQFRQLLKQHPEGFTKQQLRKDGCYDRYLSEACNDSYPEYEAPNIYGLPKIHKDPSFTNQGDVLSHNTVNLNTLTCRLISPCHSACSNPPSLYAHILLLPYIKRIKIICQGSLSLIKDLESLRFTDKHIKMGITLVTADVVSLYPNIDIEDGLCCLYEFLIMHCDKDEKLPGLTSEQKHCIYHSMRIAMTHAYVQFGGRYWKQVKGTAMGVSGAVSWANIFMFIKERDIVDNHSYGNYNSQGVLFYRRFLDDIFAVVVGNYHKFIEAMNNMDKNNKGEQLNNIKLTWTHCAEHTNNNNCCSSDYQHVEFLDLVISKGQRFYSYNRLDIGVHQKAMNLYLYIPQHSFHTLQQKRNFIKSELMRYVRHSSSQDSYIEIQTLFVKRLLARKYDFSLIMEVLHSVHYEDRLKMIFGDKKPEQKAAFYWVVPSDTLTRKINMTKVLNKYWPVMENCPIISSLYTSPPIASYKNPATLGQFLISAAYTHPQQLNTKGQQYADARKHKLTF